MRLLFSCFFLLLPFIQLTAQDSIKQRVILIGDAGEMDAQQRLVIDEAARNVIPGKTIVIYLGDNVYYTGMGLGGDTIGQQVLRSQFAPMRAAGAAVYFVPGNHDWDRSGKNGLEKIKLQWSYIKEQNDSLLKFVPENGCPDPYEINVNDSLTIIAYDSEWWLFPFDKSNAEAECNCTTKAEVLEKMEQILYRNRYKVILMVSHHPFRSYGTHGGYFTWKDHLFPLRAAQKNLYIPIPVIGSMYPLLRRAFINEEDLHHPLYKDMIRKVNGVFKDFPNVIHAAGHEHGLQFIRSDLTQIVSGSGSRQNSVKKGKHSLYAGEKPGYVTYDVLAKKNVRITYFAQSDTVLKESYTFLQSYKSVKYKEDSARRAMNTDSVTMAIRPDYDRKSNLHRKLFGENYRKEWAAPTTLPVIDISTFQGGLTPTERGGGMQSKTLRLEDKQGREWVIRSVEKSPEALIPENLRETFATDVIDDATSAQHPFSALMVPPIANAVKVPHAIPVIGVIAPDKRLGVFERAFANTVCLVELREPLGESDNTVKMLRNLVKDNDNGVDGEEFLRARMVDVLIGDWDRHADQWRWFDSSKNEKNKYYTAIPRDRDQALHLTQGLFPRLASRPWILPTLQGFGSTIPHIKYSLFKTKFLDAHPSSDFSHERWTAIVKEFTEAVTDSVLEVSVKQLPAAAYAIRHEQLLDQLKERRDNLPEAMESFYRFNSRIVDVYATDKNEYIEINDTLGNSLHVTMRKISKDGELKDTLMDNVYDPSFTKEIRLYAGRGDDRIIVNNSSSPVKLRVIGGRGDKLYDIRASRKKIKLYERKRKLDITGNEKRIIKHFSNDSLNTAFVQTNLYNITQPLITVGYNVDDGVLFGLGIKRTQQGFRKIPYASVQSLNVAKSFSSGAYRIRYRGEFIDVMKTADLVVNAEARAPDNTQNFFGRGNETEFNKTGDWKRFYRARFSLYSLSPALRWNGSKGSSTSIGPAFNYYRYDSSDNKGRFITSGQRIGSYDSLTIDRNKMHAGLVFNYINDKRSNRLLPLNGSYVSLSVQGYKGLNQYSRSFIQVIPEVNIYRSLNRKSSLILANRIGGGLTLGKTAFYQSLFVGGHENLLGYRQYRFAGQNILYNNLELRLKIAQIASYIVPGQFGATGFFDVGRVWERSEGSSELHHGVGGGLYFAPAQVVVLQFLVGHSREGWYPYFTMGFRF